ncbi:hypothetical protein SAMN04489729_6896 [Amycolatopsis lurida]|uniref:Pilus assembly protein TadE n=1 Tax=Amycolatopsis lurida NRRL 2430 TaxID=1460371 RepID=A0A2P2FNZ6_AMYLU|nr:hypothetical protein [Amycolatopsis lurida]KFU78435.1 hypothetical protein BB31_24995 [Amycolatopsis lurida NRRL 2430]SEE27226.1 hypothetical protein SAMN04489729_6896 [Amycolatopsis lurida]
MKRGDRGDVNVEVVIGVSALIVLFGLALVGMRVITAESAVNEAARSAARAASIARDGHAAASAAEARARAVIAQQGLNCAELNIAVDARDFAKPLGETGYVIAIVSCEITFGDLMIPGSRLAASEFRSPIDRYGARR